MSSDLERQLLEYLKRQNAKESDPGLIDWGELANLAGIGLSVPFLTRLFYKDE